MGFIRDRLFPTPWHLIRFFIPFTAAVPFAVYWLTVFTHVYPGVSAFLTAAAADLCRQPDLSHPLFALVTRAVAELPYGTLPLRLNLFCSACGALAVAGFYLFTARMVFVGACEDSGGAMAALPPRTRELSDDTRDPDAATFALNSDGTLSIPAPVLAHNRRVAHAAVWGGLGAAVALAFCAPFWLVATRLYPYAFDLMLFFFILNLLVSYDQSERLFSLYLALFLLAACSVESALFLLLLPIGSALLLRSMVLNQQATANKVLFSLFCGLAGGLCALALLWKAAAFCSAIPALGPRILLNVFAETAFRELLSWVPRYGWSYAYVQVLFPTAIALFVFAFSFRTRTPIFLLAQLALTACLVPSLLNLRVSPWAIARMTSNLPVFSYVIIALLTGLMIAVWHLMSEMFKEKIDEDLDYYEYRDNPAVCRIGALLCWPLLLLALAVPFRSFKDVDPSKGLFADSVADVIYRELGPRDWVVNCGLLQHHIMLRALQDGRRLRFITTQEAADDYDAAPLASIIRQDPAFDPYRHRLLNAADLSPASFLREWLQHETNAFRRVVLFSSPEIWRANGFTALPTGFFLSGKPKSDRVDVDAQLARHQAFVAEMAPFLTPAEPDSAYLFANIRVLLKRQLAFMGNELAILLAGQGRFDQAAALLESSGSLAPRNLSLLLNRYHLATRQKTRAEALPALEKTLRDLGQRLNTYDLTLAGVQAEYGTLINPDALDEVRKACWTRSALFRNLAFPQGASPFAPLTAARDRKRELQQSITRYLDTFEFESAERQLNLLLDLDDKDLFALLNKARISIERRSLPEAGLWLDLAKESGAKPADLVWHEASLLVLAGKLDQARAMLNATIPSRPSDIQLWGLLADILLRQNEYGELENRVFPALRSASAKKEHYQLYRVRGYILKNNGPKDYQAARASFLRALSLNRNLSAVREELLRLDDALGVPAFCEQDAKVVLRQNPNHAFANFLLGSVRLVRGELDKAEDLFQRSLEPGTNAPACAGLGMVLLEKQRFGEAEKLLRRSLELDRSRLSTWHALARLLLATDRLDEAAQALGPVAAGLPDDFNVRLTLIRLKIRQKRFEEAATMASDLLQIEDQLPPQILRQLHPITNQLSEAFSK